MYDQFRAIDKLEKLSFYLVETRFVGKKMRTQTVYLESARIDFSIRIEIAVKMLTGKLAIVYLNTAYSITR